MPEGNLPIIAGLLIKPAPLPPAQELTPTLIRLRPMARTTLPVTTGGKNLRRGLMKKPSAASQRPPIIPAPIIAP